MKEKTAIKFAKHTVVSGLMFLSVVFGLFPQPARADIWGASIAAAIMKQMLEVIQTQIQAMILGSLKVAAIQMLNNQIGQLVGGGSAGQARFITNYTDFLYQAPIQRTNLYMNDFFTLTTRGKGASANYISVGNTGGVGGNYAAYLESVGRQAIGSGTPGMSNLEQYTASPQTMFAEGGLQPATAFFSNPYNNPYGYALEAESAYQNKLAMEQQAAAIKAQSTGFLGAEDENGNVITPAASIEAMTTKIQNLPSEMMMNATQPGELLSGVVSAMTNKIVTNLVQKGIGQVQSNIQREIGGVNSQVNAALKDATGSFGPGAQFMQSVNQRSTTVNSSTPAIPNNGTGGP